MRGLLLAVAIAGAPALALAQTTGGASGTLLDEPTLTTTTPAEPPGAQPVAETTPSPATDAPAQQPSSVAAPGINLSEPTASAPTPAAPPHHHATVTPPTDGAAASGVAAPGVSVNGATPHAAAAAPHAMITPANALERAFIGAAHEQSERAAFRRIFLDSQVALATVSDEATAAPRLVRLGPAGDACLIFTSDARATQIMGAHSPRLMMTGREALQRLRGAHLVIININMDPYLTLDADGVNSFLGADSAPAAAPRSAGPSQ